MFQVTALDGNPLVAPKDVEALELGPAERIDAIVEMNRPGVWVFATTNDRDRERGMGIVVEYAGQPGEGRWTAPGNQRWDYVSFGNRTVVSETAERIPLVFEKRFTGRNWVDKWAINGKSFPQTDPIRAGRTAGIAWCWTTAATRPIPSIFVATLSNSPKWRA
jgi:FtsP/CotA-like multicopper oxidase with cupredoxin domain